MSVTTKLGLMLAIILIPLLGGIAYLLAQLDPLESAGRAIILVDLQRMRSQAIVDEALQVASGAGSRASLAARRRELEETLQLIRTTPPAGGGFFGTSPYIGRLLDLVTTRWRTFSSRVATLEEKPVDSSAFRQALDYVVANSEALLVDMDTIVTLYEDHFREEMRRANLLLTGLGATSILVITAGYLYGRRLLADPLVRLARAAEAAAPGRKLAVKPQDAAREDEVGILARELQAKVDEITRYLAQVEEARQRLEEAYTGFARSLTLALEQRNPYTRGHSDRVSHMAVQLARHMGLSEDEQKNIRLAALVHDIGKMAIPDDILLKPGPLTPTEVAVMRSHPTVAVEMLRFLNFLNLALPIIEGDHECWDGTGYPRALRGGQIPLGARILAVVDAYDAMTTERPYRPAMSHEQAMQEILAGNGTQFDPQVVEAFAKAGPAMTASNRDL
jgi:putative nucleotidyltransferase with HDIG domain